MEGTLHKTLKYLKIANYGILIFDIGLMLYDYFHDSKIGMLILGIAGYILSLIWLKSYYSIDKRLTETRKELFDLHMKRLGELEEEYNWKVDATEKVKNLSKKVEESISKRNGNSGQN